MKPTVGRVVYYQSYGTPGGEYTPQPRAAIVTEVDNPDSEASTVGLCVLNPTGMFFNRHTPFSPEPKPGCWNWMPYQVGQASTADAAGETFRDFAMLLLDLGDLFRDDSAKETREGFQQHVNLVYERVQKAFPAKTA